MADNDFRPPIASPPERVPATIEQVDNRGVDMEWGIHGSTVPKMDGSALRTTAIGAKKGRS